MATGASTANVAIILIDARLGVLQQSRRHAYIADLLGIPHLLVVVNKMDLVDYDKAVYDDIQAVFADFAQSLHFTSVTYIPASALMGVNIVDKSAHRTPWYEGPTVLEFLETVEISGDRNLTDFATPSRPVIRPNLDYRGFAGQIASGIVKPGDAVKVLPNGQTSTVTHVDIYGGELDEAFAPQSVCLRLADEIDISRGDTLVHADAEPYVEPPPRRHGRVDERHPARHAPLLHDQAHHPSTSAPTWTRCPGASTWRPSRRRAARRS